MFINKFIKIDLIFLQFFFRKIRFVSLDKSNRLVSLNFINILLNVFLFNLFQRNISIQLIKSEPFIFFLFLRPFFFFCPCLVEKAFVLKQACNFFLSRVNNLAECFFFLVFSFFSRFFFFHFLFHLILLIQRVLRHSFSRGKNEIVRRLVLKFFLKLLNLYLLL